MLQKLQEHITKNLPFLKGKKVLIAISGGIDSVVLAYLLHQLKFHISLAHCNFNLREEESNLDELFVKNIAKNLDLELFVNSFDTKKYSKENKISTQIAARNLRYNWFNELIVKHSFEYIVTAHHANDSLETFLINLTRGTGLDGLVGIPQQNEKIVRPLLIFSRNEIEEFATKNNIQWREDASNSETKYVRNKIRHEIVPKLEEINPYLVESFQKTIHYLQQSKEIVNDRILNVSKNVISYNKDEVKLDIQKIKALSNPKAYLYEFLKSYGFTQWNDVFKLLDSQSGKMIETKSYKLLKNRDFLLLLPTIEPKKKEFFLYKQDVKITNPIRLSVKTTTKTTIFNKKSIFVDENLLTFPLIIRKWEVGDFFYPVGMQGKKKLSKYFKDEKLSVFDKQKVWLLCSNKNEIIWVIGMRQDRRFVPKNNNNKSLNFSII